MGKFGKNSKILLYGVTAVCVFSLFAAFSITNLLTKNFQKELITHDYGVAGYLLNNEKSILLDAFTSEKSEDDVASGGNALASIGYDTSAPIQLLPAVSSYRNRIMLSLFLMLLLIFGTIYLLIIVYLWKQHKDMENAENSIREFLNGNTMSRIESEETGDWYSLFHEINELASILSAHAENEKQAKEFLQNIISDVSHQIKTPLSALKMYQEIMNDRNADKEAISSFSQKSLREIRRMEDVIYTLLKLARLDAGIIQLQKAPENLSVLIQDIVERFEIQAKRENKTITLAGQENVSLSCDALWISEAIGNIVKNALEHTSDGGQITIRWEQNPLITQIIVEDDGKGVHPEDLYNIFKRFYRSRFSQDIHGIGLGLSLAKTIIENHGGTISVTSKLSIGTTFILNFFNLTDK